MTKKRQAFWRLAFTRFGLSESLYLSDLDDSAGPEAFSLAVMVQAIWSPVPSAGILFRP